MSCFTRRHCRRAEAGAKRRYAHGRVLASGMMRGRRMSWVNDLASGLGIPAGAATLAVALYGGCSAAEKAARPDALREIGLLLRDASWGRSVRPPAIIARIFRWTFGERHLSRTCMLRSLAATVIFGATFSWVVLSHVSLDQLQEATYYAVNFPGHLLVEILLVGIVSDYC